jgi:hypothetical protein
VLLTAALAAALLLLLPSAALAQPAGTSFAPLVMAPPSAGAQAAPPLMATLALQQAELPVPPGLATGDNFGTAVALDGDTALVGAPSHTVGSHTEQGAAYVFTLSGTTWTWRATLTASDGAAIDDFGAAVALSGDTALVGAPFHKVGSNTYQGAAYVFTRSGTSWSQQGGDLTASDGAAGDQFGDSVALSGDTALVGVPYL